MLKMLESHKPSLDVRASAFSLEPSSEVAQRPTHVLLFESQVSLVEEGRSVVSRLRLESQPHEEPAEIGILAHQAPYRLAGLAVEERLLQTDERLPMQWVSEVLRSDGLQYRLRLLGVGQHRQQELPLHGDLRRSDPVPIGGDHAGRPAAGAQAPGGITRRALRLGAQQKVDVLGRETKTIGDRAH